MVFRDVDTFQNLLSWLMSAIIATKFDKNIIKDNETQYSITPG